MRLLQAAHLPALTVSESGDDDTDHDYDGVNDDETSPQQSAQGVETDYEYSVDDEEIDPSEVFPELATEAPTHETVTEAIPDVTENEVETQATLIEVLDEIFEDPSLPREEQHDVPRSPQFFVPTPIPAIPNQAGLTFETHLDEEEHAFHNHFLSSVEGEASLVGKMFRDEQDIQEQEALHHHEDHEGHHQVAENEIPTSAAPRPGSEHKGRRVLKKRPIRIKIPAGLRQNLQVIPESLTQDVKIQDDDIIIATPTATAAPALSFQEPEAAPQLQVFNPNLLNRPTTPSPRLEPEQDFIQEPRQPKALTVFSADDDTPEEVIFGQEADNVRQQEAVPQNFSPIFAVPSRAGVEQEEARSGGLLLQQNVNIDTSAGRSAQFAPTPAAPAVQSFNAAQTAANSPPPTFRPILRQPSDYIFTPQQFSAPAIQQQQQPQQFANGPFQQQTQQQFRQAEAPPQQFRPQSFQQQDQDFSLAPNPPQQQQAFTSFSPPVSQRQPPQAPALSFQEPAREQKAFPQQQVFNNNFLSRPTTPVPQQQQQFNTNFAPRPQDIAPPQTFTQTTPAPPRPQQQQQFNNNFAPRPQEIAPPQSFTQSAPAPPQQQQQQQQQFNNNFAPPQTFTQSTPSPPPPAPTPTFDPSFSSDNNFNNNFNSNFAPASPSQVGEQSLFAMINRQAADRPVRTKLQQSDKSILRPAPK